MNSLIISHFTNMITDESTGGCLVINGERFCETIEDVYRGPGAKIYGLTCIPRISYNVGIRRSSKFKRDVVYLYSHMDGARPVVTDGRIEFDYCYAHGMNTAEDSLGCVGVAHRRIDDNTISGTAESGLFLIVHGALASGKTVVWDIIEDLDNRHGLRWQG